MRSLPPQVSFIVHEQTPTTLTAGKPWESPFVVDAPGEAWIAITLAAPGTSWERGEAAVVTLDVDGGARQEIIVAGGEDPVEYLRLLGPLPRLSHSLRIRLDPELSSRAAREVTVGALRVGSVGEAAPEAFIWRHAPILHYRALESPLDSVTTDTPLLLFHRPLTARGETGIEYHVIYSHEDEGTDLSGLLACWGHTTDIEWVYRVVRDEAGRIVREEFQGPGHEAVPFRGGRACGRHPVLQVSTRNGLVTDRVTCPFRVALAPALAQPRDEPREGVQHRFPWITRVSALEVLRQVPLEALPAPASRAAADPRCYLFLQWKRAPGATLPLEAGVRVRDTWYTSAWGRPDLAFREADAESTAVKLPAGTTEQDVTAISLRALEPSPDGAEIRLVRAFFLDAAYRPRRALPARGACRLVADRPLVVVWHT